MIEQKEIKSIEHLDLLANQIVEGSLIGLHKSPFHGFSAEFREHKLYNEVDSIKNIDYKVFARTDKMYVKKFDEETNLNCQLVLDVSASMYFPIDAPKNKLDFSIVAIASLMKLLKKQRDAFGLTILSDTIQESVEPKLSEKNKQHIYSILHKYLNSNSQEKTSNIATSLHQLSLKLKKRSLVVLFSDLIESKELSSNEFYEQIYHSLQHLLFEKHEVIVFHVLQKNSELLFDYQNKPMEVLDIETNERVLLTSNTIKETYSQLMTKNSQSLQNQCVKLGVDYISVDIDENYNTILNNFLRKRKKIKR